MQCSASRLQRDIEEQKAMLGHKTFEDLQKLQVQYFSDAAKECGAHTGVNGCQVGRCEDADRRHDLNR
jgi:uncharacterized protein YunC (DUF1805 family)